jgi:hypothetical protein
LADDVAPDEHPCAAGTLEDNGLSPP